MIGLTDSMLLAIGFYNGPYFGELDDGPDFWEIRIGENARQITSIDTATVWQLCRGIRLGDSAEISHRREDIIARAHELDIVEPEISLDRLLDLGLVVEIGDGGMSPVEFARVYRVEPLLVGYGNAPDRLDSFYLGASPERIYAVLTAAEYDAWIITPLSRSILHAAHEIVGRVDDDQAARELQTLLPMVGRLVAMNALYVDALVGASALPDE